MTTVPPGFTAYDGSITAAAKRSHLVTIGKSRSLSSCRSLMRELGSPERVSLYANQSSRELAVAPATNGSYSVAVHNQCQCALGGVLSANGWEEAVGKRHPYRIENGVAIITLDLSE